MAKKNSNNQSVNNQSANSLKYATYTSAKSGKTIPVVYGFTDKDDERIPYIAQIGKDGEPSAVHGRYTCLPVGKGGERIPCVMWGAHESWHEVAKLAAKTVSDLDALTQEGYDALCEKADKVYQQRKAASEQERKEREAQKEAEKKAAKPQPKSAQQPAGKADGHKAKTTTKKDTTKAKTATKKEVTTEAKKQPKPQTSNIKPLNSNDVLYTQAELEDVLRKAMGALATAMKTEAKMFEPLIKATLTAAKAAKVA